MHVGKVSGQASLCFSSNLVANCRSRQTQTRNASIQQGTKSLVFPSTTLPNLNIFCHSTISSHQLLQLHEQIRTQDGAVSIPSGEVFCSSGLYFHAYGAVIESSQVQYYMCRPSLYK